MGDFDLYNVWDGTRTFLIHWFVKFLMFVLPLSIIEAINEKFRRPCDFHFLYYGSWNGSCLWCGTWQGRQSIKPDVVDIREAEAK